MTLMIENMTCDDTTKSKVRADHPSGLMNSALVYSSLWCVPAYSETVSMHEREVIEPRPRSSNPEFECPDHPEGPSGSVCNLHCSIFVCVLCLDVRGDERELWFDTQLEVVQVQTWVSRWSSRHRVYCSWWYGVVCDLSILSCHCSLDSFS